MRGLGDEAAFKSLAHGLGLGMNVQFIVDAANVVADGVDAHVEVIRGCLVAVTICKHPQQPDLVGSEVMVDSFHWTGLAEQLHDFAGDLG